MTAHTKEVELGPKGRVVIPAEIRAKLQVQPGDKLLFIEENGEVRLTTRRAIVGSLRGAFKLPGGRSLSEELLAERRAEAEAKGW